MKDWMPLVIFACLAAAALIAGIKQQRANRNKNQENLK